MAYTSKKLKAIVEELEYGLPSMFFLPDEIKQPIADIPESENVEMVVLPCSAMSGGNGKKMPAVKILLEELEAGHLPPGTPTIVPSSGNTVLNVAYSRQPFQLGRVMAVIEKSVPEGKRVLVTLPGAEIYHPRDGQTTIERAYELQQQEGGLVIDQYKHPGSVHGHEWTMDHIAREMKRLRLAPSFFCAGAGTCSTLVAAHEYLKPYYPKLQVVGAACASKDDPIPGCRTLETIIRDITFDWRLALAPYDLVFCKQLSAYERSRDLMRAGHPAGPSAGLALQGFFQFFREHHERGDLEQFLNRNGKYVAAFLFMDSPFTYMTEYKQVLGLKV